MLLVSPCFRKRGSLIVPSPLRFGVLLLISLTCSGRCCDPLLLFPMLGCGLKGVPNSPPFGVWPSVQQFGACCGKGTRLATVLRQRFSYLSPTFPRRRKRTAMFEAKCLSPVLSSTLKLIARQACSKLFVGGLSYDTNETLLKDAFEQHGETLEVKVICDHVTAKSKGYGFVQFKSESDASTALQKMDGQLLDGRNIRVHYANKGASGNHRSS